MTNTTDTLKCSCYGGFDCEVCNPDYYEEMKTTDTPRTDTWECFSDPSYYDMARLRRTDGPKDFNSGYHLNNLREAIEVRDTLNELERRAEKAEAEVERLKEQLESTQSLRDSYRTLACSRISEIRNLKAEFERLRAYLLTALNISTWTLGNSISNDQFQQFQAEIRRIKDSINYPDNK